MKIVEKYMPFKGYKVYIRICGECEEGKLPLLAIHGGPGAQHDYLESFDAIPDKYGRQVIYYDSIGCGNSPVPWGNPDLYSQEMYEEELAEIRKFLGLDHCHILGQSWGGMLAMLYATHHPVGVESMIVASSPASGRIWVEEANKLIAKLPQEMQDALAEAERTGNYETPEYKAAYDEYYRRHVCNLDPKPDYVTRGNGEDVECYRVMQGSSEFVITGKMKDYDVTADLPSVTIPTLVTSGSDDEATPRMTLEIAGLIPGAKYEIIEGGTHLCHCEFPELYNEIIEKFMEEHE